MKTVSFAPGTVYLDVVPHPSLEEEEAVHPNKGACLFVT
jgi:hypothetical protein